MIIIIAGAEHYQPMSSGAQPRMDVSLITGSIRQLGVDQEDRAEATMAVVSRDSGLQVATTAGEALKTIAGIATIANIVVLL